MILWDTFGPRGDCRCKAWSILATLLVIYGLSWVYLMIIRVSHQELNSIAHFNPSEWYVSSEFDFKSGFFDEN